MRGPAASLGLTDRVTGRSLTPHDRYFVPLFAGIGTFLSFFHQGSLGGMYGVLFGRPFVYREGFFNWPWTFFLFISSAIATGPGFTMLCATFMETLTGRKLLSALSKAADSGQKLVESGNIKDSKYYKAAKVTLDEAIDMADNWVNSQAAKAQ